MLIKAEKMIFALTLSLNCINLEDISKGYVLCVPAHTLEKKVKEAIYNLETSENQLSWQIQNDGSMGGQAPSGQLVFLMAGSEFTSEYLIKRELFRLKRVPGRFNKFGLSDFSPSAQKGLVSLVKRKFPDFEFGEKTKLCIETQISATVRFPNTVLSNKILQALPLPSYEERFPRLKATKTDDRPLNREIWDILIGSELVRIPKSKAVSGSTNVADRFETNANLLAEERLSRIEEASREVRKRIIENDDALDFEIQSTLLETEKRERFIQAKKDKTLGELIGSGSDITGVNEMLVEMGESNFTFLGYTSASAAREAIPKLQVRTSITFGVWLLFPDKKGPRIVDLF